jgi:CheY-like chemotaxis protein
LTALRGTRVLVVEDEPLLSMTLQDMLDELECEVVGTAARLEPALSLASELAFDIAVLDINLGGRRIDPVAEAIAARALPFIFVTGYGQEGVPRHLAVPVVEKPYETGDLQRALLRALGTAQ